MEAKEYVPPAVNFFPDIVPCRFARRDPRATLARADTNAELEVQVSALATLNELDLTSAQLRSFQQLSNGTAAVSFNASSHGGPDYHETLAAYRDALISDDDDRIAAAQDKVDEMRDRLGIDPQMDVPITDAARDQAASALKLLNSSQIANFISMHADEVPDATATIEDALDKCRDGSEDDFISLRAEAADQVGLLAGGFGGNRAKTVSQQVSNLLDRARRMPQKAFNNRRGLLDRDAQKITDGIDSFEALRHWMAKQMAVLLSNPRIESVLDARLKTAANDNN